jgi:uncharacterized protein (TIGR03663 family)
MINIKNFIKETKESFSYEEWLFIWFILITGLVLRWYQLDFRPFHHDESLNAIYGLYYFKHPATSFYRYDPLLHGPLMYNLQPYIYQIFGATKWSSRAFIAAIGSTFIFFPFLFRKYFNKTIFFFLISAVSLSPTLVYWSKFVRHDFFVVFFMFISFWGITQKDRKWQAYFAFIPFALQFTAKENTYMTVTLILGYFVYEWFVNKFLFKDKEAKNGFSSIKEYVKEHPAHFVWGLTLAVYVYCYFFTSGFNHPAGILDGLYRKSLSYWSHQHSIERIKGPFMFQALILAWYEYVFIAALIVHALHFYIRKAKISKYLFLGVMLSAVVLHVIYDDAAIKIHPIWTLFKMKLSLDFYPLLFLLFHSVNITTYHLRNKDRSLAFLGYFFFASFFTYSYIGEKVPWLSMYPLVAGIIYLAVYFQSSAGVKNFLESSIWKNSQVKKKYILLFLFVFCNLREAILTNFTYVGEAKEFIGQVHTTKEFENILLRIRNEIEFPVSGRKPMFLAYKESTWPTTWHFFEMPQYTYNLGKRKLNDFDYILNKENDKETEEILKDTHTKLKVPLRGWYVPDYTKMNWSRFFGYMWNHTPWSTVGNQQIMFFVKKDYYSLKPKPIVK